MTQTTFCGEEISSRRGFLASLWFLVNVVTAISFVIAFSYVMSSYQNNKDAYSTDYYQNYDNQDGDKDGEDNELNPTIVVTSRALAFCATWTAVFSALLSLFGTVLLGWQSPVSGQFYTCCSSSVHRTTPLGLGSFIGALLMVSNMTLTCSVLFGEFEVSAGPFISFACCSFFMSLFLTLGPISLCVTSDSSNKRRGGKTRKL